MYNINSRRLNLTIKKLWFENRKAFLLNLAIVAMILTIWLGLYLSFQTPALFKPENQIAYFFVGLIVSGSLVANFLFSEFNNKSRAINYLTLPASHAEKLLSKVLLGIIFYLLCYTVTFLIVDTVIVSVANNIYGTAFPIVNPITMAKYSDPFFNKSPYNLLLIHFIFQAVYVTGALFFKRYAFLKSTIILCAGWMFFLVAPNLISMFLPTGHFYGRLTAYEVIDNRGSIVIEAPGWLSTSLSVYFLYLLAPALIIVAFLKLREKQIN
jgi:hypothetical protein